MVDTKANITFIKKQPTKPYYDSSAITGLVPKLYFKVEKRKVLIVNAREIKNNNFEASGYEICDFKSKFNKNNIHRNLEKYKEEINIFLKNKFNYLDSFIFDLTRRSNSKKGAKNKDGRRQPADRAHVDYTKKSGEKRAKDILGKEYFKKVINSNLRIIQLNLWKPLCKVVLSSPIAFALPSTVLKKDLVATNQVFPDRVGEIYHLAYNKNQKWLWVPDMKNYEVLLLKGWDSSTKKGMPSFTPHTSFDLKKQNINKNPRDSIEARIFLILKK
ncbi:MAG: hypothetical protein CFH34_01015 [Alphaproteobacteria bacterium MarineAlpha9_Bin4]|nr:methyltransferase [Pelagibacterales bacterium]PPR26324.1 MAG: hypothetical protein CFH34_01015 [Alphaproteobacteria bacterium MarineAlpha9_Bin4]|tara:strand:- start:2463 stop:3281 length:819 start_codon:yes stop_codon:yes gene_type:complete